MFGLVIPGRELTTQFVQDGPTTWTIVIPNPAEVSSIAIFMTDVLSDELVGVGVYFSHTPPFSSWQFLGALANSRKSDVFHVAWPWLPETQLAPVTLRLVVEPASLIMEQIRTNPPLDVRRELARKTALHLFHFLQSFNIPDGGFLQNGIDQWFTRFEQKYERDPNFVLRAE